MKFLSYFKSRTVWMVIGMFVIGGVEAVAQILPTDIRTAVIGFIGVLAIYFRVKPKQQFGDGN